MSVLNRIDPTVFGPSRVALRLPVCTGFEAVPKPLNVALAPIAFGIFVGNQLDVAFHDAVPVCAWKVSARRRVESGRMTEAHPMAFRSDAGSTFR